MERENRKVDGAMICCCCNVADDRTLYWFIDPETNERCAAHAECGDEHGLEDGKEAVDL